MNTNEEHLAHHGIKGQKWGLRRFQNSDGSLTEAGRKHYGIGPVRGSGSKAEKAGKEKLKEEIVRDPRKITKYAKAFSREEVNKIISDIEWNKKLYNVRRDEKQRRLQRVKDMSDSLQTFANLTTNGMNLYNNGIAIYNALVDSGKVSGDKKKFINRSDKGNKENNN